MKQWLAVLLIVAGALQGYGQDVGEWYDGRATHFGKGAMNGQPADPWSIHKGHCQYGRISKDFCTGWNVAALADQDKLFKKWSSTSACGICIEVKCRDAIFKDGYGQELDRMGYCYDKSKSVIVQVVDKCECHYKPNEFSNKRWCCGDMQHMDLSSYSFAQLAPIGKGVIPVSFRQVPCSWASKNANSFPEGQPPMADGADAFGNPQPRPCGGSIIPAAQQMKASSVFRPGGKCIQSVGAGMQCGGKFRNKRAMPGLADAAWAGFCCKAGFKCKRFNAGWWSCEK